MPSVGVFSSSETVPFHVSFCSSAAFLGSIARHVTQSNICLEKPIHVFILRRTTVLIGNSKNNQDEVLGIGRIFPSPITAVEPILDNAETLSWDGEIHCEGPIEYSSFTTSVVEVKVNLVYILLNLGYSNALLSGFLCGFTACPPWPTEIHSSTTLSSVSYSSGYTPLDRQILSILHHLFKQVN